MKENKVKSFYSPAMQGYAFIYLMNQIINVPLLNLF